MKRLIAALLILAAAPLAGSAQQQAPPSAAHIAAARALLEEMDTEALLRQAIDAALQNQMESHPELAPYQSVLHSFMAKYMSWQAVGDQVSAIYAESFTEAELGEMLAFYRTPTGRKMARLVPELMARGGEIGRRAVTDHMQELQQMMSDAMAAGGAQPKP
jgi:hypothetical protein